MRNLAVAVGQAAILVLLTPTSEAQAQFGTEREAKAMLEKAVAAVKENKEKALEMFNKGEGGFKDRDLYVFCANASDGVLTAHPYLKGEHLQDIVGKKGYPLGQEIMKTATEGKISEVSYWWPRPGSEKPLEKRTFYTKVGRVKTAESATTRNERSSVQRGRPFLSMPSVLMTNWHNPPALSGDGPDSSGDSVVRQPELEICLRKVLTGGIGELVQAVLGMRCIAPLIPEGHPQAHALRN